MFEKKKQTCVQSVDKAKINDKTDPKHIIDKSERKCRKVFYTYFTEWDFSLCFCTTASYTCIINVDSFTCIQHLND